jgi:hypothetical protein
MTCKKWRLAAAMLGAAATGAQAVHMNPGGMGQVLIYPYYNVNNNFQTNLHIVNTQNTYKIVKVRLRESGLSKDVLDFNIYMSPYDAWTGVVRNLDGKANLISEDNTCTLPANDAVTDVGKLSTTGWDVTSYNNVSDADAREGYIEVIEVGNIPDDLYTDMNGDAQIDTSNDMLVQAGLKHSTTGVPDNCDVVTLGWTAGNGVGTLQGNEASAARENWQGNGAPGVDANGRTGGADGNDGLDGSYLLPPSGGLRGHAIYLNTSDGSAFVNEATALDNYSTMAQHWRPDDATNFLLPSLASGNINTSLVIAADGTAATSAAWGYTIDATRNDGDLDTPASGTNPWPVASTLMATTIVNDYFIDPIYEGATDWVITFPMRNHGIYNGQFTNDCTGDGNITVGAVEVTTSTDEGTETCFLGSEDHVFYTVIPYNREELFPDTTGLFDVPEHVSPSPNDLPRGVNVLQLGTSGVLGSDHAATISRINENTTYTTTIAETGVAGWMSLSFGVGDTVYSTSAAASIYTNQSSSNSASFIADGVSGTPAVAGITTVAPVTDLGVPVVGFAAQRGSAPSIPAGANFGETVNHAYVR